MKVYLGQHDPHLPVLLPKLKHFQPREQVTGNSSRSVGQDSGSPKLEKVQRGPSTRQT